MGVLHQRIHNFKPHGVLWKLDWYITVSDIQPLETSVTCNSAKWLIRKTWNEFRKSLEVLNYGFKKPMVIIEAYYVTLHTFQFKKGVNWYTKKYTIIVQNIHIPLIFDFFASHFVLSFKLYQFKCSAHQAIQLLLYYWAVSSPRI